MHDQVPSSLEPTLHLGSNSSSATDESVPDRLRVASSRLRIKEAIAGSRAWQVVLVVLRDRETISGKNSSKGGLGSTGHGHENSSHGRVGRW